MTWFRADDNLADHPKVRRLGKDKLAAMGMWTLVGTWVGRYDNEGFAPNEVVERYDPRHRLAKKLVAVGLWEVAEVAGEPGFIYHDWFDQQPSIAEIEKKKAQNRERQRRFRARRAGLDPMDPGPGDTAPDGDYDDQDVDPEDGESHGVTAGSPPKSSNGSRNALGDALVTAPRPDPSRPVVKEKGHLGGESLERNAREKIKSPPTKPRCERHRALADDDPGPACHGCKTARLAAESSAAAADTAERTRRAALANRGRDCDLCDEHNWVLGDDGRPLTDPARKCTHRPLRSVS